MFNVMELRRAGAEFDRRRGLPSCSAQRHDADIMISISVGCTPRRGILVPLRAVGCACVSPSAVDRAHRQHLGGRYQVQPLAPEANVIDAPSPQSRTHRARMRRGCAWTIAQRHEHDPTRQRPDRRALAEQQGVRTVVHGPASQMFHLVVA